MQRAAPGAGKDRGVGRQRLGKGKLVLGIPSSLSTGSRSVKKGRYTGGGRGVKERHTDKQGPRRAPLAVGGGREADSHSPLAAVSPALGGG